MRKDALLKSVAGSATPTVPVSVRITPKVKRRLDRLCKKYNAKRSPMIATAIERYLDEVEEEDK